MTLNWRHLVVVFLRLGSDTGFYGDDRSGHHCHRIARTVQIRSPSRVELLSWSTDVCVCK